MKQKIKYILDNWKLIIHLLFKTKHFGVNNTFWFPHDSIFSSEKSKRFTQVVKNYKMMRIRSFSGFIPLNDAIELFPDYAKKNNYKPIIDVRR
ncbi:MAG: hypothetical protein U9P10_13140 [Thermodesulfobacteriota bacterium]|nr:hypothetical protein [Thermodesulfobacteriota bacterium]